MKQTLSKDHVKRIAKLANLPYDESSSIILATQLSSVLDLIYKLQKLDTSRVAPTSQVTGLSNVFREDETAPSLTQEQALSNAKRTHKGFFVVPAVFD